MPADREQTYCCVHALIAAAEEERRHRLPPVVTVEEYFDLDWRASQRHEYVDGVPYPKEYPPRFFEHRPRTPKGMPAHARALDFCWYDAHVERHVNTERWRALLTDARDWNCDLDAVRGALMELADIAAQFTAWEQRVRRLWASAPEPPATTP
jgi:hypothetical protein